MVPEGLNEGSDSTELAEIHVRQCLGSATVENRPMGVSDFVPKGLQDSAWGFNPRYRFIKRPALKGR